MSLRSLGPNRMSPDDRPVVYFAQRSGDQAVKIGTTADLTTRLRALRREHGPVVLLRAEPGGHDRERALHGTFARERIEGEWFRPTVRLGAHLAGSRSTLDAAMAAVRRAFPGALVVVPDP
jgi:hypothetical protein